MIGTRMYAGARVCDANKVGGAADAGVKERVASMIAEMRAGGEDVARKFAKDLDKYEGEIALSEERIATLVARVHVEERANIDKAIANVRKFAEAQKQSIQEFEMEVQPGLFAGQRLLPVKCAGCYAPGGLYAHVASAIMSVSTAQVAGVERVIFATPPRGADPDPAVVYAAHACGAHTILAIGGVQAIGALRFGFFTGCEADILVGPGNAYVAEAKRMLYGETGIDMFAGPTEIAVVADETGDPEVIATDLVSQGEHGPTSPMWLMTTSRELGEAVIRRVPELIALLPERSRVAAECAWRDWAEVVLCDSRESMRRESDRRAGEHVEVHCKDLAWWLENLSCYGSLFLGEETTVTYGDKISGPNHVLPTKGSARYTGGLSVHKFLRTCTYQRMDRPASRDLAASAACISRIEGMEGHARAADARIAKYSNGDAVELLSKARAPNHNHVERILQDATGSENSKADRQPQGGGSIPKRRRLAPGRANPGERPLPEVVADRLCGYIDSLKDQSQPVVRLASPDELRKKFIDAGISLTLQNEQEAVSEAELTKAVDLLLEYSVRTGHPMFNNQLYARADPVAIAADWVSAATNTNCHTYEVAPVYTLMEAELLSKVASIIGGSFSEAHDGLFVPGGSISNLYGLHLARSRADPEYVKRGAVGGAQYVALTSDQSHYSYLKSARLTGLGADNLVSVRTDANGKMVPEALEVAIGEVLSSGRKPFFVGSTAGTTVIGAYDPLDAISDLCQKHGLWHHVDACWGGGALLSEKHRHELKGVERVDSLAWNPHKMSGTTLQCSVFVTRHAGILAKTNGTNASYLFQPDKLHAELDTGDKTIQCGRKTDMFKLWLQWKAIGDAGMRRRVDHCFELATYMAERIRGDTSGRWQLVYEPSCSNVCFWYVPAALRPFSRASATPEQLAELGKVAPAIKGAMQRKGDAMIGFQAVNGHPNFFRMVFASADVLEKSDIDAMMERMAYIGEQQSTAMLAK